MHSRGDGEGVWHTQVGTETEGSLMAPAERTGATAMRPSFGAVGRSGIMSLVDSLVELPWLMPCPMRMQHAPTCCVHQSWRLLRKSRERALH